MHVCCQTILTIILITEPFLKLTTKTLYNHSESIQHHVFCSYIVYTHKYLCCITMAFSFSKLSYFQNRVLVIYNYRLHKAALSLTAVIQ